MNARAQTDKLLKECGAVLKRGKKHEVWQLPNGQKFTRASTPGDFNSDANALTDLKHALGMVKTEATTGERRVRKLTAGKATPKATLKKVSAVPSLADGLHANGLIERAKTEQAYKDDIQLLQEGNALLEGRAETQARAIIELEEEGRRLKAQADSCWLCRLRKKIKEYFSE